MRSLVTTFRAHLLLNGLPLPVAYDWTPLVGGADMARRMHKGYIVGPDGVPDGAVALPRAVRHDDRCRVGGQSIRYKDARKMLSSCSRRARTSILKRPTSWTSPEEFRPHPMSPRAVYLRKRGIPATSQLLKHCPVVGGGSQRSGSRFLGQYLPNA
ncbi:hypothetical protein ANCDUO_23599 [Ancylostoma duodenale]|uniref:Uncharacterized protein n=1 Tax=Ancylostoma duodenale TaxID=51022 RepID=A0A0C2FNG8_9BILA|nr:hypothetical protein ANCDUO_23599 [Ancylostoma duodenale]